MLSHTETKLLRQINTGLPTDIQSRYDYLLTKRKKENLNDNEYRELLEILGITSSGGVTVDSLKLNRTELKNLRKLLSEVGKHPPE